MWNYTILSNSSASTNVKPSFIWQNHVSEWNKYSTLNFISNVALKDASTFDFLVPEGYGMIYNLTHFNL